MALDGDDFEERSATLLENYGLQIVARQYRCKAGEIDLIACDEHRLVFVEVRARRHRTHGGAAASVNRAKQCRIARCASHFLNRYPRWRHLPCRFDVVTWEPTLSPGQAKGPSPGTSSEQRSVTPTVVLEARWIQAAFIA